jgi:hypothetical protein
MCVWEVTAASDVGVGSDGNVLGLPQKESISTLWHWIPQPDQQGTNQLETSIRVLFSATWLMLETAATCTHKMYMAV